jgi:HAD superfamily hydrolase (TIGR01490 family)
MNKLIRQSSRLAIFDFDGTLCRLNSYHVFLRWLMRRPAPISLKIMSATALRKAGLVTRSTLMNIALNSLKGKTRDEVELIGRSIFEKTILPNLNKIGISEMKNKHDEGYDVIILSGAFDFILKPFCDFYEIDHWHSTQITYSNGICTGRLNGIEFLGEAKRRYLQDHFFESKINWPESCAYSDELADLPLLSMVGSKFFVVSNSRRQSSLAEDIQCVHW